ncbi:hypothetical protein [Streptomyces albipurpureus]|uniref:XRE family transcriptional regulator n=1 Tax=Streptomyces albipurpureus TaxID=2897419 RepID=A0ABT0UVP3_9ACTN|nr:hypothetical protein [Streptomyces sp. CWNU-1]MCM2392034.1 hypothetical protein [Streptomyces sp. CWNU-1]
MVPAIASRIPLVRRLKAPALPLEERITHLTGLTVAPAGAGHHDLVARASGVLNYAALIASDVGMPDLATELCWRQHQTFAKAGNLTGSIAVMSLMPLINIARLLTREGDGEAAYDVLTRLYRAAQKRETTEIHGHTVDLKALISTNADHRKMCEELWTTLLIDGARALARIGHWTEAAKAMNAHRGVGNRLLDGRQITIMALMERGLDQQALDMIDTTAPTEPWETTIAALLRAHCRSASSPLPSPDLDLILRETTALLNTPAPAYAVFQTRAGLAALDLPHDRTSKHVSPLTHAIATTATLDAYAARETLNHPVAWRSLNDAQQQRLSAVITEAGLGSGYLSAHHLDAVTDASESAETVLDDLL